MSYISSGGSASAIRQLSQGVNAQGATIDKRGNTVTKTDFQHLNEQARVFHTSNAARETALAVGGTSFSDTAPAFSFDVPAGVTVIPIRFKLNQGGTVAGGQITVLVCSDSAVRQDTGGTLLTLRALRDDAPIASRVDDFRSGATISANTLDVTHFGIILDNDVATIPGSLGTRIIWPEVGDEPPILIGPASLQIYTFASGTQPSWFFSFVWAEIDS